MKLNQALTVLKNLKSKLKRTDVYLKASAVFAEDTPPEYIYQDELKEHYRLINEIISLKNSICHTNVNTFIESQGRKISLQELILNNATFRSELAFWTEMLEVTTEERYSSRTRETVKKVYAPGYSKADIKARINNLEASKEFIESLIAKANAETDLLLTTESKTQVKPEATTTENTASPETPNT